MGKVFVIGIAGGSGSGKSTLCENISRNFGNDVIVISHDDYYKAHHEMSYEEKSKLNYDHPDAYDTDLLIDDLTALKNGLPVCAPVYDFTVHDRSSAIRKIEPARIIIIDGILIFENEALRSLMDLKIFVDTDADLRILRRMSRDMETRKRSFESVSNQYLTTVKPMHDLYVEPSKKYADMIVNGSRYNPAVISLLVSYIQKNISE